MSVPVFTPVHNWRNSVNRKKRYKVYIRIHLNGDDRYHEIEAPTGVALSEWRENATSNNWIKASHPYHFEINNRFKEDLSLLSTLAKRYYDAKKSLTFPIIFKELKRHNNSDLFNKYYEEIIKDPPEHLDDSTIERYRTTLGHLNDFNAAITFNDLSEDLVMKFKKYLSKDVGLVGSTINGYFNALKKVIEWSRKEHQITREHQKTIFEDFTIKIGKPKKDFLEVTEIQEWESYQFPPNKYQALRRDRDLFSLQIYTGFYYNDLRELLRIELKHDHEFGPYFYGDRFKNDNLAMVPLWKFPAAMPLIKQFLNPITDPKHPDYKYLLRRDIFQEDQPYNRALKRIATVHLKWTRRVYNKLARQTNSQLYIRFGATRPIVAKMLGQEKEESASYYFDVNIKEVIEGVKNIDFSKVGIGQKIAS